ncbi:hypothetical protein HDU96_007014 [Phlyctochytrium bullatum]|nr:hypothetical protein HDU96_007014 [Phlyctochytrium bullatum]
MHIHKVLSLLALLATAARAQTEEPTAPLEVPTTLPPGGEDPSTPLTPTDIPTSTSAQATGTTTLTSATAITTPATTNGNCGALTGEGLYPLTDVYACYNSFPLSTALRNEETERLKSFYEVYPFGDLNVNPPKDLFQNKVNFLQQLDTITASATNLFDYYSKVSLLVRSLNDAHFSYSSPCISSFTFMQPLEIAAFYPASAGGKPVLRVVGTLVDTQKITKAGGAPAAWTSALPSGTTFNTFTNYTVKSIDGQDAVTFVQDYAAKFAGFSRSADTNFNYVLFRRDYMEGVYASKPGPLYFTPFLGNDAKPTRSYTLVPPNGGNEVTLTFPWYATYDVPSSSNIPVPRTNEQYFTQFCVPAAGQGALQRRDLGAASVRPVSKLPTWSLGYSGPIDFEGAAASASAAAAVGPIGAGALAGLRALDVSKPTVKDASTAFYVLDDGTTGVWVFATTQPTDESEAASKAWIETIFNGFYTLNKRGVKKLIIDVSGNGGGQFCTATGIAEFLLSNTTMITDQIKLTNATRSLMKLDFLGFQPSAQGGSDAISLSSSDITASPTRKDRGGGPVDLSGFFRLCQNEKAERKFADAPRLEKPWAAADIAVVSDGFCGSACACMIRSMRDAHGIKAFTYGGASGKAFTPTSYEGGIVQPFTSIATYPDPSSLGLTAAEAAALPRNFTSTVEGQIPITQGYSFRGKFGQEWPAEFIPAPADVHLTGIEDITDRTAIWKAVAAQLGGSTGTSPAPTTSATATPKSAAGGVTVGVAAVVAAVAGVVVAALAL